MEKILLVEDDASLGLGVEYALREEGYQVLWAKTFATGKSAFEAEGDEIALAVLDINLPDGNGYELCKIIKGCSQAQVLFLTALDDEVNVVLGLEIGGDDYLTKPFRVREFLSRVKKLLERSRMLKELRMAAEKSGHTQEPALDSGRTSECLVSGEICLDKNTAKVTKNGVEVPLTAQEYRLLLIFMSRGTKLLGRNEILSLLKEGEELFFDENTLSVYIKRLREKIEGDPSRPHYIVTHRGLGYVWNVEVGGAFDEGL